MLPTDIESKLRSIEQWHLLTYWESLALEQKNTLISQIRHLDIEAFNKQKALLKAHEFPFCSNIKPLEKYAFVGNAEDKNLGLHLLSQKKCGCLLLAGGQGTRLRHNGPKGMYPVTPIKKKTLFQLFAEKTLAAGNQSGGLLSLAIMTSPLNHDIIVAYFKSNSFFGLNPAQVFFYSQDTLPLLDSNGDLFLEDPFTIAAGPDGNGSALKYFVDKGIWKQWNALGIEYVNVVLIDNPLADPFDAELLGFHVHQQADVCIKSAFRLNEEENVGLIVQQEGHIRVVEYSEISSEERTACLANGTLKYPCANLSLFCMNMEFIKNEAYSNHSQIPLHKALKAAKYVDEHGLSIISSHPMAWKFERFIFDLLPFAHKVKVLVYPREICFAPLKNFQGADSLETVQAALQKFDRIALQKITLSNPPKGPFELSQDFHYPTPQLLKTWKRRPIPDVDYISP
jgi:UDP-N-acetylglucosamine/UDP-N-acetylgalactosamine diphosphorylase